MNPGRSFVVEAMSLPGEGELVEMLLRADPDALHAARNFVVRNIAQGLRAELQAVVAANSDKKAFSTDYDSVSKCVISGFRCF